MNAKKDLLMRLKLCQENADDEVTELLEGIDSSLIENATVRREKDKKVFEKLNSVDTASGRMFDILYDDIGGFVNDRRSITGYAGLKSSLGAIFANPLLVAHVLAPYCTADIDFESYLNTLRAGAKYVLTFDELVIYIDPRRKIVNR